MWLKFLLVRFSLKCYVFMAFIWHSCALTLYRKSLSLKSYVYCLVFPLMFFWYFYRLKKYSDWFAFSSHHFPLVNDLPDTNNIWKIKFCFVDASSLCLALVFNSLSIVDDELKLDSCLRVLLWRFNCLCIKTCCFPEIVLSICSMSLYWKAKCEVPMVSLASPGEMTLVVTRTN